MDQQLVTQAAYAAHARVSRQAVGKMKAADKLVLVEKDGKELIDLVASDLKRGANVQRILAADLDEGDDEGADAAAPAATEKPSTGLTAIKIKREGYAAQLAELDLQQRLGKLRPVEDITKATQLCAETMLRQLGRMRGRADELTARAQADGVAGVRSLLAQIERDLRKTVSDAFAKLAAGELPDDDMADELSE
jgi:hypothetical protein